MNENVLEIERAIDEVRAELGKVLAQKHLTAKQMAADNNQHEALNERLQAALQLGRDDLAAVALPNKWILKPVWSTLENTLADCVAQENELERFIAALQAKKREMQHTSFSYGATRKLRPRPQPSPPS